MLHELESLRRQLQAHASQRASRQALQGLTSAIAWGQLLPEVERREAWLAEQPPGSLVLGLDNEPDALCWDLAALFAGRACVILPPFFSAAQRHHCLMQTQATLAVVNEDYHQDLSGAGFTKGEDGWHRAGQGAAGLPEGTAKITYTSGSTGSPKGVCLSTASLLRVAQELEAASRPTAPGRYLAVLPLAVLLENLGIYAALLAGATITLYPQQQLGIGGASQVDWQRLLGAIALTGAESLILVPQLLLGLVTAIERGLMKVGPLRFVAVGGARVASSLLERAAAVGLPVFEGYGLSECASVVCLNRPGNQRQGSVGRPLPHVQVRIAEDGEVLVHGSTLLGYLGEPPFAGDWWPTGDLGHFDDDGFLYLAGRKKNQFITSFGRNVNPEWIEAELSQTGVIRQAFVYGEGLSRNLALLWPVDPQTSDETIAGAVQQCNAGLPDYARIHAWQRLSAPFSTADDTLTSNGRLRREQIQSRYQSLINQLSQNPEV